MSNQRLAPKKPRFYYGRAEKVVSGKAGYQLCLADLKTFKLCFFEKQFQLYEAIDRLASLVIIEKASYYPKQLEVKRAQEMIEDNLDDDQGESEFLTGEEHPDFELLPFLQELKNGKNSSLEADSEFEYYQAQQAAIDEKEAPEKYERLYEVHEPVFGEDDFTSETGHIPIGLLSVYNFFDVKAFSAQAKVANDDFQQIKNEVCVIFHPERVGELIKCSGLRGFSEPSYSSADSYAGVSNK